MNKTELINVLKAGLSNLILRQVVSSALFLIQESDQVSIKDYGERAMANKERILRIYRFRQKRAQRIGGATPDGFNETILSLAQQTTDRIKLILVDSANQSIVVWLDYSGSIIGCYFGKEVANINSQLETNN